MARPDTLARAAERCVLAIVPDEADEKLLERAASVAAVLQAELEVYCPIVAPPAPHSWMTPQTLAAIGQLGPTRERGRRLACSVEALLNEREVGAHVEAGICESVTAGVLHAAGRLEPALVIYADPGRGGPTEAPYRVQRDAVLDRLGVPVWIVGQSAARGDSVLGIVASGGRPRSTQVEDERIARTAAGLAARFRSKAYLLACERRQPALAMVREVMAPSDAAGEQSPGHRIARHAAALARDCGIPAAHVQLHQGSESVALEALLAPLKIGLVVTSGAGRGLFGGLTRKHRVRDLTGLASDLLVLGETDVLNA